MRGWILGSIATVLFGVALITPSNGLRNLQYLAPGGTSRTAYSKLSDQISVKDYGAPCDGTSDDQPAFALAIAALPATGGVIHAEMCSAAKFSNSLTIGTSGTTINLPAGGVALGANQIIVPVGVHNVALIGSAPYGGSIASSTAAYGTFLTYTGSGAALLIGDSTNDTYGFHAQDFTVGLSGAGSAAIGIQLTRCPMYSLTRFRTHGATSANTQIAIDLEGGAQFTGGRIDDPYLWQGNTGIYFGQNANANYVVGGIIVNSSPGGGTCFNIAGAVGGNAVGNVIIGTDCESGAASGSVLVIDRATKNYVYGLRSESVATYVNATANSNRNVVIGWSPGTITDLSTAATSPNNIMNVDYAYFNQSAWQMRNKADASQSLTLWSGSTVEQQTDLNLSKFDGTRGFTFRKNSSANFQLLANSGVVRMELDQGAGTFLNSEGTTALFLNQQANSSTGGVAIGTGGASPTTALFFDASGFIRFTGVTQANLGAPANGRMIYCTDCTIANPCAAAGTGAIAKRLNGVWVCN